MCLIHSSCLYRHRGCYTALCGVHHCQVIVDLLQPSVIYFSLRALVCIEFSH